MIPGIGAFLYVVFILITWIMISYTLNFYYLSYQSLHNLRHQTYRKSQRQKLSNSIDDSSLPIVTIQIPLYNEIYVASRLIHAVCQMDYPKDKLEIQILDDSDDETVDLINAIVGEYKSRGFDIDHIRRANRSGYKAGALKAGMNHAKGEFIAIFDADFVPPPFFIKKTISSFSDPKVGLVQCRWGHINESYSTLTEAQAISLDLHFMIEQKAKSFTHLFMNFNGAAGIWRKLCINDSGGWHTSTLVEDLDLSYRAQMRGWKFLLLDEIVVQAELPIQMNAAKRQQFRWAKGSMQLALKLLLDILSQRKVSMDTKIQAFIQLTRYLVHPLFLAQFLIFPILLSLNYKLYNMGWAPLLGILIYLLTGPVTYIYMIRKIWHRNWVSKARQYFFLIFFSSGISVNNCVAVVDGLMSNRSEFLRTPKFGIVRRGEEWKSKFYALPFTKTTLLEIFFAVYGCMAISTSIFSGNPIFVPLIGIQTIGFIYIAYLSIVHSSFNRKSGQIEQEMLLSANIIKDNANYNKGGDPVRDKTKTDTLNTAAFGKTKVRTAPPTNCGEDEKSMKSKYHRLWLVGILGFIAFGGGLAFYGYQATIYPIDRAVGYLSRAETSQTPNMLISYITAVKKFMPEKGNPVWSFSTPRTDFELIQSDLSAMVSRARSISSLEPQSAAYNTGLEDIHQSTKTIETNLEDATPYLYVSYTNLFLSSIWISVIMVIFAIMKKRRIKFKEYETT